MQEILNIINQIAETSSRLRKEEILLLHKDNEDLRRILYFIYNPFILTGIADKKYEKITMTSNSNLNTIFEVMDYLKDHFTGRDTDIQIVKSFIESQPKELQEFYKAIVTKNLKIGITAKTINKCLGKSFIPEFNVMLAKNYFDEQHKVNGEFIVTLKIDGIRALFFNYESGVKVFTRQGQPILGLHEIEKEMNKLPKGFVYDGELLLNKNLPINELYRATVKEVRKDGDKKNVIFHAFDMVSIDEFFGDKNVKKLNTLQRKELLKETVQGLNFVKYLEPLYIGNDKNKIIELLNKVTADGYEGTMVNNADAYYECKRSSGLLKCKKFKEADVRVLDVIEGTGKYEGKLGAITIQFEHDDRLHECNCGSGFSDEERQLYFDNPELILGKIVVVGYFEISENQEGGFGMRFPIWKNRIRDDKDEISMH